MDNKTKMPMVVKQGVKVWGRVGQGQGRDVEVGGQQCSVGILLNLQLHFRSHHRSTLVTPVIMILWLCDTLPNSTIYMTSAISDIPALFLYLPGVPHSFCLWRASC